MSRGFSKNAMLAVAAGLATAVGGTIGQTRAELPMFTPATSRGKGKGKRPHRSVGTRAYQRAALKKRNQQRHRKACR